MKKLLALTISACAAACGGAPDEATPDAAAPAPDSTSTTGFTIRIENIAPWTVLKSGLAAARESGGTGAIGPGDAFDVTFTAGKNQKLSFASMLGESNDWFFGPGPDGIALYDTDGNPRSGDVTAEVDLWNAGTEIDQEPGVGSFTGPHQTAPDQGDPDPDPTVREIPIDTTLSDGSPFTRPEIASMLQVTLTPGANRQFTVRIANVSTDQTLVTSLGNRAIHASPVVWALHGPSAPLFTPGEVDRGQGLELVAESGRGATLSATMGVLSGAATPISPGVWALGQDGALLYDTGVADPGLGLERVAESGMPTDLAASVTSAGGITGTGVIDTPDGASAPGPIKPGGTFTLHVVAQPGDRFSWVAMFGMSDDWFFATPPGGLALFDADGTPLEGDVSDAIGIYDAGTEVDEELAIGPDTGPQQPAPDTGAADPIDQVREVASVRYGQPASAHLRVTVMPDTP